MNRVILTVKEMGVANNAGPKAKLDIEKFLTDRGFEKWNFYINQKSMIQKLKTAYIDIPFFLKNKNNVDEIYLQYPTYSKIVTKQLVKRISRMDTKLILIIHDVESLRLHLGEENYIKEEIGTFNMADGLIVHNEKMKDWLTKNNVTTPMVNLGLFDYENTTTLTPRNDNASTICFAGNLNKAHFLKNLAFHNVHLNVYGPNPQSGYGNNVYYKGQYSPDELPKHLTESFGLVWDGSTAHTCDGVFGNYMKFNNPHKVSLYLSSGIPVIIWKQAALANFIEKENLGIAISDLNDLDNYLSRISSSKYHEFSENAKLIALKLRKGFFINQAVDKLEELLRMENNDSKQ